MVLIVNGTPQLWKMASNYKFVMPVFFFKVGRPRRLQCRSFWVMMYFLLS